MIFLGMQKHFAMFVLQVGEKHAVPSVVQHEIALEVSGLFSYFTSNYNDFILYHLKQLGFEVDADDDWRDLFNNVYLVDKALSNVSSESKILNYCKSHLGFMASKKIRIKTDINHCNSGTTISDIVAVCKKQKFIYILIAQVISRIVQQKSVGFNTA